jgi:hypothetical protein
MDIILKGAYFYTIIDQAGFSLNDEKFASSGYDIHNSYHQSKE